MFINKDQVDFCYMTSAMLLEALNFANPKSSQKPSISWSFKQMIDGYDKNVLIFPPENYREMIYFAYHAILNGEHQTALTYLLSNIKIWETMQ